MLRLSKVFVDPLRMKILAECNIREMSPKLFLEGFGGGSLARVARAFEVLVEYGWLELVRTETGGRRRGGIEHFYVATELAVIDESLWPDLPTSMREMVSWRILETFFEQAKEALVAGTFDARTERHLSWAPAGLDQEGWRNVIAKVDALFYWFLEEQERAKARMATSGEEPIQMTFAIAAFESPKETEKQP